MEWTTFRPHIHYYLLWLCATGVVYYLLRKEARVVEEVVRTQRVLVSVGTHGTQSVLPLAGRIRQPTDIGPLEQGVFDRVAMKPYAVRNHTTTAQQLEHSPVENV